MIIASAKNKSVGKAFVASLLFGVFALIYYIFAQREPNTKETEAQTFTCTNCKAEVTEDDDYCPKCGTEFEDDGVKCPKCKTLNPESNKYCSKCGRQLFEEPEPTYDCGYCNKTFKREELRESHRAHCAIRLEKETRDKKIAFWVVGGFLTLIVSLIFLVVKPINIIPTLLVFFAFTPYFDRVFDKVKPRIKYLKHHKLQWWTRGIFAFGIIVLFVLINLVIPECPETCDDGVACTNDFCDAGTGYVCMNSVKLNCNGNQLCESGEYGTSDCPNCDDKNKCTSDSYDVATQKCLNVEMKGCIQ